MTQTIRAPIERVFEAWTRPEIMVDWYAPTDDFKTPIAEVDLRVGGVYRVGMQPPGADVVVVGGQYCRIEPPNALSFTWAWQTHDLNAPETQVTIELRPNGDCTDLTLIHERFRDESSRDRHAEGWAGCVGRLASKLGT